MIIEKEGSPFNKKGRYFLPAIKRIGALLERTGLNYDQARSRDRNGP
jgi:hypothetical protein